MFGKVGLPELILILAIALIIFGPRKLPEIGKSIGKGIREFKSATAEIQNTISLEDEELKTRGSQEKPATATVAKSDIEVEMGIVEENKLEPEGDEATESDEPAEHEEEESGLIENTEAEEVVLPDQNLFAENMEEETEEAVEEIKA